MRFAAVLTLVFTAALASGAYAQTASEVPHKHNATYHRSTPMTFTNPGSHSSVAGPAGGQSCIGHNANAAQTAVNPITGKAQAAPFVVVPVSNNGGSVASATTRAQQAQACAQAR